VHRLPHRRHEMVRCPLTSDCTAATTPAEARVGGARRTS
jgi:hypothetical protein